MPASASFEIPSVPLARRPALVAVYRYYPGAGNTYELLPNIRVLAIHAREGPDPGMARFRYVFDPADPTTDPTSFEQALSVGTTLINIVNNDDRLVVFAYDDDGDRTPVFDGFAQVPELSLSHSQELVTFVAFGVAVREWDMPVGGAVMRDADDPSKLMDVETDLPTHFNPSNRPNATPSGSDATDRAGRKHPTFLDSLIVRSTEVRRPWTLPMAVRYLCFRHNPLEEYVRNPDGALIDALLDSRSPISGILMDPGDPSTYSSDPIRVPDYHASGKAWPVAVHELIEPHGFGMVFRLEADVNGDPRTRLDIFRRQDGSPSSYKDLYLQPTGEPLDPSRTNLAQARLARDVAGVANEILVESDPIRHEASFVLAPGFPISAIDAADAASLRAFDLGSPSFSKVNHDQYRLYVFDETGEGHWDAASSRIVKDTPSLDDLFGPPSNGLPAYVKRRRVPFGELFTKDANQKPLKARLAISTNYQGPSPGLWNGTGTWQAVVGGFQLLGDRLGIWINVPNPNGWNIGQPSAPGLPYASGIVKGVEDQAGTPGRRFVLRLTCVVESDRVLKGIAGQRPSSSTSYAVARRVDAGDRYAKQIVAAKSEFNTTTQPAVVRDDSKDATSEASSRRLAAEAGEVAGSVMIPRFTLGYRIGDKIRSIVGRDLSLRTNAGAPEDEGEIFPAVVAVSWDFDSKQNTVLQLSDHRGEIR